MNQALIAVGAAVASALLFLVAANGVPGGGLVALFTPLPIMIVALGFGHRLGLLAVAIACLFFVPMLPLPVVASYVLALGLPAWFLAFLTLLGQRSDGDGTGGEAATHWYPLGRLLAWAAAVASAVMILSFLASGLDPGTLDGRMHAAAVQMATMVRQALNQPGPPDEKDIATVARMLPAAYAVVVTLHYLLNLYLAARIVRLSGRLVRPWPGLPENIRLPRIAGAVFMAGAALALLLPGGISPYAGVVASAFGLALAIHALALIHATTRPIRGRPAILAAVYIAIPVLPWATLALVGIGLVDVVRPRVTRLPQASLGDRRDPPHT